MLQNILANLKSNNWMEANRLVFALRGVPFVTERLGLPSHKKSKEDSVAAELLKLTLFFASVIDESKNFKLVDFSALQRCEEHYGVMKTPKTTSYVIAPFFEWVKKVETVENGSDATLSAGEEEQGSLSTELVTLKKQLISVKQMEGAILEKYGSRIEALFKDLRAETYIGLASDLQVYFESLYQNIETISLQVQKVQNVLTLALSNPELPKLPQEDLVSFLQMYNRKMQEMISPVANFLDSFSHIIQFNESAGSSSSCGFRTDSSLTLFTTDIESWKKNLAAITIALQTTADDENIQLTTADNVEEPQIPAPFALPPFPSSISPADQSALVRPLLKNNVTKFKKELKKLFGTKANQVGLSPGKGHLKIFINGKLVTALPQHPQLKFGTTDSVCQRIIEELQQLS